MLSVLILLLAYPAWAMEHYVNTVQDRQGNAIPGTQITVYIAGSTNLAEIFSDNQGTPKANPFTNNANGSYEFYAVNSTYDIYFFRPGTDFTTSNEIYRRIGLFDVNDSDLAAGSLNWPTNLAQAAFTSEDTPMKVRGIGSQADSGWNIYMHSNGTPVIKCVIAGVEGDCNIEVVISSGKYWALYDDSANLIMKIEPGASGMGLKYTFGPNYRPVKSIWFGAASLYGDGTQCPADPTAATINSGPKIPTFICTDNDSSTLYGSIKMPDAWDAGTVTFTHVYIQTAANTGALNGDIACQAKGNGEAVNNTWGTEVAIDDAAVTGSNQNDFTTSAAVTCSGTPAAGDMLYWRYQLDATGTTTTIGSLHHVGFMMEYAVTSLSD